MLELLKSQKRARETKLSAVTSLGDLALYAPINFCNTYLIQTMDIMYSASEMSLNVADFQDDYDILDYLGQLRISLVDTYITLN
jgi:hypothetical protein